MQAEPPKQWSPSQNLEQALSLKQQGNKLYQMQNLKEALRAYHKALLHLAGIIGKDSSVAMYSSKVADPDTATRSDQLKYTIYLNMAQIYIQQQKYDRGLDILTKASAIENTTKLYYRRGICLMRLSEFGRAREDFNNLISMDSRMKGEVDKLMEELRQLEKKQDQKSKNMFQKFFK